MGLRRGGVSDQERPQHPDERGGERQGKAVPDEPHESCIEGSRSGASGPRHQLGDRHQKPQRQRQEAHNSREPPPSPAQLSPYSGPIAPCSVIETCPPALDALEDDEREDEQEQDPGQAHCRDRVVQWEPRAEDARRECRDAEILYGPVVVEHLHQHQRQAAGHSRPRHREGDSEKRVPGTAPEGPCHLQYRT